MRKIDWSLAIVWFIPISCFIAWLVWLGGELFHVKALEPFKNLCVAHGFGIAVGTTLGQAADHHQARKLRKMMNKYRGELN